MKHYVLITFFLIGTTSFSQTKFEKETRVKPQDIPATCINVVETIPSEGKIKWYKEESETDVTFEAKTSYKDQPISIEFYENGILQDAEITIEKNDIPVPVINTINLYLTKTYKRYKIKKIQYQISGKSNKVVDYLNDNTMTKKPTFKYEIILKGITDDSKEWYEYTFDASGNMESRRVIIFKSFIHLEF